jgi:predicted nucleic acid-binding protein
VRLSGVDTNRRLAGGGSTVTSRYVLSEPATTLLYEAGHRDAVATLTTIRDSSTFNILEVADPIFARTVEQFAAYDDQQISFIDHLNSVLGEAFDIKYIFAFEDDFRTLGMTRGPVDTGETM